MEHRDKLLTETKERPLPPPRAKDRKPHPDRPAHPSRRSLWLLALAFAILLAVVILAGYIPRHRRIAAAAEAAREEREALPVVNVVQVRRAENTTALLLPGNITALTEASIYARASGYLRRRYVDIGDRVRAGQLLADIEAPELDQQVAQGRAALAQAQQQAGQAEAGAEQAQANLELARTTWDRFRVLSQRGVVSKQEADQQATAFRTAQAVLNNAQANVRAAQENITASRANVERLMTLQQFEQVRAPFSGVVTARNVDVGALISAAGASSGGSGGTSAPAGGGGGAGAGELFRMAQIDTLRIMIDVPQSDAPFIHLGQRAYVVLLEFPGRRFEGRVTRTSNALDPATRTLLTEVQVPNPRHELLPGMYSQVQLTNNRPSPPLLIPGDSLISNAKGLQVAVFQGEGDSGQGRIRIRQIQVGRDYGPETEVIDGLQTGEWVVQNPNDAVRDGAEVRARKGSPPVRPGGSSPQKGSQPGPGRVQ